MQDEIKYATHRGDPDAPTNSSGTGLMGRTDSCDIVCFRVWRTLYTDIATHKHTR
jgi:hypothetical protein